MEVSGNDLAVDNQSGAPAASEVSPEAISEKSPDTGTFNVETVVGEQAQEVSAEGGLSGQAGEEPEAANEAGSLKELLDGPLTDAKIRQLRRLYFTVRHGVVNICGHRLDAMNEPRNRNCEHCWFAWLNTHAELVKTADRAYREQGKAFLIKMRGAKFTKMFESFMATVAKLRTELQEHENERKGIDGTKSGEVTDQTTDQTGQAESPESSASGAGEDVRHEGNLSESGFESRFANTTHQDESTISR